MGDFQSKYLHRASTELEPLRMALPRAHDNFYNPDWITPILSEIDWSASDLKKSCDFLSKASTVLERIADDLDHVRTRLLSGWQGQAAAEFDGYATTVAANSHSVAADIDTLHRLGSPDVRNGVADGLNDLTRNVWDKAREVASNSHLTKAITDTEQAWHKGEYYLSEIQPKVRPILDGETRAFANYVDSQARGISDVFTSIRTVGQPAHLKDPFQAAPVDSQAQRWNFDQSAFSEAIQKLLSIYQNDIPKCDNLLESATEVPGGIFGNSDYSYQAEGQWKNAVAARGYDAACCASWEIHMLEGVYLTFKKLMEAENTNLDMIVSGGQEFNYLRTGQDPGSAYGQTEGELANIFKPPSDPLFQWLKAYALPSVSTFFPRKPE